MRRQHFSNGLRRQDVETKFAGDRPFVLDRRVLNHGPHHGEGLSRRKRRAGDGRAGRAQERIRLHAGVERISVQQLGAESRKMFNQADAIEKITVAAVNAAPAKGANYAYVILPSEFGMGGLNMNAFRDVYVAHYKCEKLPPVAS
jgi:hypothetical protein